jgi:hypothetical protein
MNLHHSPLRSRGASARRADTNRSHEKEEAKKRMRAGSKKKGASSRSKSRPKSKGKKASFIGNGAIKKEFNNFKRVMTAGT